jgi:hypothetical protein
MERCQANQMMEKEKIMKEIIIIQMVVAVAVAREIMAEEEAEGAKEDAEGDKEDAAEESTTIVSI